jgi:hypothetical protein
MSTLADIPLKYDSVRLNTEYPPIRQLWKFQPTRVVLHELLISPIQRLQKQLAVSAEPRYRMIPDLLGFHLAQHVTRSYLAELKVAATLAPSAIE